MLLIFAKVSRSVSRTDTTDKLTTKTHQSFARWIATIMTCLDQHPSQVQNYLNLWSCGAVYNRHYGIIFLAGSVAVSFKDRLKVAAAIDLLLLRQRRAGGFGEGGGCHASRE